MPICYCSACPINGKKLVVKTIAAHIAKDRNFYEQLLASQKASEPQSGRIQFIERQIEKTQAALDKARKVMLTGNTGYFILLDFD